MSQSEVNEMVRVLKGERRKYTVRVHRLNGEVVEYQSDYRTQIGWHDTTRSFWLQETLKDFSTGPIMQFEEGMVILCEENPT